MLSFNPELEQSFRKEFALRFVFYRRILLLLASAVLLCMAAVDIKMLYSDWKPYYIFRYAVSGPVISLFLIFSWTPWFKKSQNISLSCLFCFIVIITIGWMALGPEWGIALYSTGIVLMIIYAGIMLRLRLPFAIFCVCFTVVAELVLITLLRPQNIDFIFSQIIYCTGASAMAIVAAYYNEQILRTNFLNVMLLELGQSNLEKANQRLEKLASQDSLTQIANRRFFDERFSDECSRARREQYPISLLMLDIDHFKEFNDNYGHAVGDECLIDFAAALSETAQRPGDIVARYGGEEFIILLPKTDQASAMSLANNCLNNLAKLNIKHEDSPVANIVTASIGLVTKIPINESKHESVELLQQADEALYKAKATGKNKIVVYKSP